MPPRSCPTARQQRLGAELRKLRERAGMTGAEAGGLFGGARAQISHIEAGRFGVSGERVRAMGAHYSSADEKLIDALVAMADERGKGWWEDYRGVLTAGFLDLAEMEHHATHLRMLQIVVMPGLFQTEDYARTLFAGVYPPLPAAEVDARVEHRMRRRAIFDRQDPTPCEVVIHEAALRMRFGGRKVIRNQLEYLLEVGDWPFVTVRMIPFANEGFIEATQGVLYARAKVPQLDTVQVDGPTGGGFLDADAQLEKYRALFDVADNVSLGAEESNRAIRRIVREL